ncbi:hypothetical protein B296_00031960, partial [Ensete ventricosum]
SFTKATHRCPFAQPQPINPTSCPTTAPAADGWVRRFTFYAQFLLPLLLPCVAPSTIEGEDRSSPPPMDTSELPLSSLLSSEASSAGVATISSFLRCCHHPEVPPTPSPSPSLLSAVNDSFLSSNYC